MARPKNFAAVARELETLQESLGSVVAQTKKLSKSLVGGLERQLLSRIAAFEADVQRRIEDSTVALAPRVDLLSALGGIAGRRPSTAGRGGRRVAKASSARPTR